MTKNKSFGVNSTMAVIICTRWLILITHNWNILNRAIFSQNVHWRTNKARSWLLSTLTFRITWIYQSICQRLSLPLYDTPLFKSNRIFFLQCRKVVFKFKISICSFASCFLCVLVWAGKISLYFVCAFGMCSCLKSAKFEKCDFWLKDKLR